jgi:hypothetical protein
MTTGRHAKKESQAPACRAWHWVPTAPRRGRSGGHARASSACVTGDSHPRDPAGCRDPDRRLDHVPGRIGEVNGAQRLLTVSGR